ncbi:carcinoembryonic antigen-related cell adhesion molecule 2 [Silurus meridionalis]|nr:carcinoembryonic antigen-related cell adhesion molecule 2 [Silurus meridionalis]
MQGGYIFIWMFPLLCTFVGRGADGERVTGVLHGRVELHGRYGQSPDVDRVEWTKHSADTSTRKLIFMVIKPNITTCTDPCRNIDFDLQTMTLILVNLTLEDEGTYEEKTTLKNNTVKYFNFMLSLLYASNITISSSPGFLTLKCEIFGEFKLLRWFRNDLSLPDDQRFSFTENNKTMKVSNPVRSDCGTYTCQVSNENETSEVKVSVTGEIPEVCEDSPSSDAWFCVNV